MSLKYAVIGTGAIGGYYGGKLAKAGQQVHFLFHSDYEYVKEHGLQINSVNGDFHLDKISAYKDTKEMPACDVILVGLKTTNNYLLKELLPPLLHENTIVLLIQNGLGPEEDLQKEFPSLQIAGGLAFICSHKSGKGEISHLDYGRLNIGSYSCKNKNTLQQIADDFTTAGVETHVLDLEKARWMKLVWNIPYNGLTVVADTTTDRLMQQPDSIQLIRDLMIEVIQGANAAGKGRFTIEETYADKMLDMTTVMKPYSPSMKLDYEYRRPLEIEYIYQRPVQVAARAGIEMKKVSILTQLLSFCESRYQ